jgi:hypothetical protein
MQNCGRRSRENNMEALVLIGICFLAVAVGMLESVAYGYLTLGIGFVFFGGIKITVKYLDNKED